MNEIVTILKKELRSYFLSPVALIFLGVFLVATLFTFFTFGRFFARNIADVRPLFEWLPVLLIFLVAAIAMRSWSEEQKLGTLEILMTLPVRTSHLVLGKLAAGMALVALALALTLPLPLTVRFLGDLDWGPVLGGYLGALLLATAYMAIGMSVSSRTDNQIVALMLTVVLCGLLFLVGSDTVVGFAGDRTGELLRALGSGSRFASIERGVLDLRDLFYYGSLTVFFVLLNAHFLEAKRADRSAVDGRRRGNLRLAGLGLAAANLLLGNLWLAPVTAARADLTEDGLYSVSGSTRRILAELDEPLHIAAYFSEKTHPLLAPLVPRIRDLLREYEIHGGGKVELQFADPNRDEELEQEIAELYDIKPVPFRVSDRHEESVVNSYFHVLVRYGDQYETLSYDDLIEIYADLNEVDVRLRNLEYDLTRTIRKVGQGFRSLEAMFARLELPARLSLFVTPDRLPEEFHEVPARIREAVGELEKRSAGKLVYDEADLTGDEAKQQELFEKYGFRPLAVDLFGDERFYLHLLLESGSHVERIHIQGEPTKAALKTTIEAGIKRSAPGFLKTVGLLTAEPEMPPPSPGMPPGLQPRPRREFRELESRLSEEYEVRRVDLKDGVVPGDVDMVVVARPGKLSNKQKFALDQFLMRGGSVVALVGGYDIDASRDRIEAHEEGSGIRELLAHYGVEVQKEFVLDKQNARFPIPIEEQRGFLVIQRIALMDYPFFPDVRRDGFGDGHVALSGLQNVVLNWVSPLEVAEELEERDAQVLLSTSADSWVHSSTRILPDSVEEADRAFVPTGELRSMPVAVAMAGRFKSYYADRPSPLFGAEESGDEEPSAGENKQAKEGEPDRTGRTLKESAADTRLVVVGSSAFASDLVAALGDEIGGGVYRGNFQLVRNLVDWSLADTDLMQIRTAGAFARTLAPLDELERSIWEYGNYVVVLIALAAIVLAARLRRASVVSLLATSVGGPEGRLETRREVKA